MSAAIGSWTDLAFTARRNTFAGRPPDTIWCPLESVLETTFRPMRPPVSGTSYGDNGRPLETIRSSHTIRKWGSSPGAAEPYPERCLHQGSRFRRRSMPADDHWGVATDGERHINKASLGSDVGENRLNRRRLDAVNAYWRSGDGLSSACSQPEDNVDDSGSQT